jgi:hypothetical protein
MNTQEINQRLAMIQDDVNAIRQFIYANDLVHIFQLRTEQCDEAITHLNNIEIACDLDSEESLSWKLFTKPSINNTNEPFKNVKVINTDGLEAETISMIEPIMLYSGDYEENETTFVVLHNSKGDTIRIFPERIEPIDLPLNK